MARAIAAVLVGYLFIAVWVMMTLTLTWKLLGPAFAFRPGTTDVTLGWIGVNLPLSFVGAALGGLLTAWIGQSPRHNPVRVLAGVVFILGVIVAVGQLATVAPSENPSPPTDEEIAGMSAFEASRLAVQPVWYGFAVPVVGFLGILLGGRLHRRGE